MSLLKTPNRGENLEIFASPPYRRGHVLPNKKIPQRLARFRQINMDNAVTHHDALEFPGGEIVLLSRLYEGQGFGISWGLVA